MKDPLPRNNNKPGFVNNYQYSQQTVRQSHNNSPAHNGGQLKKRSNYCWNFNRGLKCKYGKKCRYYERCSYSDSYAHEVNVCPKLEDKPSSSNGRHKSYGGGQKNNKSNSEGSSANN